MPGLKKIYYNLNFNLFLFLAGVIAGSVIINFFGIYAKEASSEILSRYITVDNTSAPFTVVFAGGLIKRAMLAVMFLVFFEAFDNIQSVCFCMAGFGIVTGIVLTTFVYYMGIKGVPAFVIICFPHVFIYFLSAYVFLKNKFTRYYAEEGYINHNYKEFFAAGTLFLLGIFAETINALYIIRAILYLI
ncbi:MAG: hypothetical protein IJM37_11555 [Lachnospiraceae bacterium]|nr:hypothetical protein [Lachnospiraceae bacterium]